MIVYDYGTNTTGSFLIIGECAEWNEWNDWYNSSTDPSTSTQTHAGGYEYRIWYDDGNYSTVVLTRSSGQESLWIGGDYNETASEETQEPAYTLVVYPSVGLTLRTERLKSSFRHFARSKYTKLTLVLRRARAPPHLLAV